MKLSKTTWESYIYLHIFHCHLAWIYDQRHGGVCVLRLIYLFTYQSFIHFQGGREIEEHVFVSWIGAVPVVTPSLSFMPHLKDQNLFEPWSPNLYCGFACPRGLMHQFRMTGKISLTNELILTEVWVWIAKEATCFKPLSGSFQLWTLHCRVTLIKVACVPVSPWFELTTLIEKSVNLICFILYLLNNSNLGVGTTQDLVIWKSCSSC